ncbi:MAG: glycosyltransferase family 39 protein [Candidatus Krumholzibacteria bacterium]|nr:glycosyltransferase family 39 protein [Candidatus Krumholzibacteria bacterium]MDP6670075.1 glycosyltransferase family 39 protein [Candidatus Krumholzibacteria bacterium]MDP6796217.1 glycosyltransferase family 39 protein [Candidatus Krumholzibacteria bacterium]MDP7022375.1 glycosyltransferase family 39 protein [Candidatus Krumholzibacteria bacterium]
MKKKLLPWILSLLPLVLLMSATSPWGPGVTPDSVYYLSTADSLADGKGFLQFDGTPYTFWPPLYPLLISLGSLLAIPQLLWVRLLGALCIALSTGFALQWLFRELRSPFLAAWASLALLLSPIFFEIGLQAWTEGPFLLFSLLFLLQFLKYRERESWRDLILAALWATLAWLCRHPGITLVASAGLLILFTGSPGRRLVRALGFGVLATLLPAVWILRNLLLFGAVAGERAPSTTPFHENLIQVFTETARWILPARIPFAGPLALAGILLLMGFLYWKRNNAGQVAASESRLLSTFWLYILLYLALLVWSSSTVAYEPINMRYLSAIYLPLVLLLLKGLDESLPPLPRLMKVAAPLVMSLLLFFPTAKTLLQFRDAKAEGAPGFLNRAWSEMEILEILKKQAPVGKVFSNAGDALYLHCGIEARMSPRRFIHGESRTPTTELADFLQELQGDRPVYLVFFQELPFLGSRHNFHSTEEIGKTYRLQPFLETKESVVFLVLP